MLLSSFQSLPVLLLLLLTILFVFIILLLKLPSYEITTNKVIAAGTFCSALAAFFALSVLAVQVYTQTQRFNLEKRPYLYVQVKKQKFSIYGKPPTVIAGGVFEFRNVGQIPASKVETNFVVANEVVEEIKIEEWFNKVLGGYPHIECVFPNQINLEIPIHPQTDNRAKFLFIDINVKYIGHRENDNYWFILRNVYKINLIDKKMTLIRTDTSWDRNEKSSPPEIDWKYYLGMAARDS